MILRSHLHGSIFKIAGVGLILLAQLMLQQSTLADTRKDPPLEKDTCHVSIYKPDKCYNGYTLFGLEVGPELTRMVDMNGRIINQWEVPSERSKYLPNGNVLMIGRGPVREFDWKGNLVWQYTAAGAAHHDLERLSNGNTVLLYREPVPEKYLKQATNPARRNAGLNSDVILEVTPHKDIVFKWHQYNYFDINWYRPNFNTEINISDWTHTNTVRTLPENKWFDGGDKRFKPGNYLISLRNLDTILIVDRQTKKIVWRYSGNYKGGLSGQHEPHMIEKGLPGAGHILIFDNGVEKAHHGHSIVLEINPVTLEIAWTYEAKDFYSPYRSTAQRLPNGNTFICEADHKRMFEVTAGGEIVWEYWLPRAWRAGRAQRVAYHFGPKLSSLPKPKETPVTPTKEDRKRRQTLPPSRP